MSNYRTNYIWRDYDPNTMPYIEDWLDEGAVQFTGLDNGFRSFYEYWANEDGFVIGESFWCKVICEQDTPLAVIAFCQHEQTMLIMEIIVAPQQRARGIGTKLLKELLTCTEVIGYAIQRSDAVIFPSNVASQKIFEKVGYQHHHTYEDGSAIYYVFDSTSASAHPE